MKITHQKQYKNKKNSMGVLAAGVAGAVALAGVATVAATIALKDEKTRGKVKKVLHEIKDQALDYAQALKKEPTAQEAVKMVKKVAKETKEVVKNS